MARSLKYLLSLSILISSLVHAQTFNLFKPANGILKGQTSTYVTTAAASSDVTGLWTGTCNASTFLRGDGACSAAGSSANPQFDTLRVGTGIIPTPASTGGIWSKGPAVTADQNNAYFSWVGDGEYTLQFLTDGGISQDTLLDVINVGGVISSMNLAGVSNSLFFDSRGASLSSNGNVSLSSNSLTGNTSLTGSSINIAGTNVNVQADNSVGTTGITGFEVNITAADALTSSASVVSTTTSGSSFIMGSASTLTTDTFNVVAANDVNITGTAGTISLTAPTVHINGSSPCVAGSLSCFANLGTTTTVLHGNAAGNPSYGAVSLTADVSGILGAANGGTGNGFTAFSGPASSTKTFTLPNASATILTTNAAVTVAQGGTGAATLTGPLKGNGTSAFTAAVASDIVGLFSTCSGTKYLGADGACHTVTASAGGSTTQIQFNDTGSLNGDSQLTWDNTNKILDTNDGAGNDTQVFPGGINVTTDSNGFNFLQVDNNNAGASAAAVLASSTPDADLSIITTRTTFNDNICASNATTGAQIAFCTLHTVPFKIYTNGTLRETINTDGGITLDSPTGGSKGAGTLNATGLYVNGTAVSSLSIGGSNTQVQYNNSGALGGDSTFTFNSGTKALSATTVYVNSKAATTSDGSTKMRIVSCAAQGSGTVLGSNDGCASNTHNGTGDITVAFSTAFAAAPVCNVTSQGSGGNLSKIDASNPTTTQVRVVTVTASTGAAADAGNVHIICIGQN